MQKGFSIVVLLIVLVAVAVGGYLVFQNQGLIPTKPTPSPTIQDETANWKTYKSNWGYVLKYPDNFIPTEDDTIKSVEFQFKLAPGTGASGPAFKVSILTKSAFKDSPTGNLSKQGIDFITNWQTINVGGMEAHSYITHQCAPTCPTRTVDIPFDNAQGTLNLQFFIFNKQQIDQILSTFKFTDQNSLNLSKTSPNDSYSVSETMVGDYNTIVVKNSSGKVVTNDLIKKNEKAIGYGTKFGCQCGTSFGGWIDGSHFVLKIVNGNGEEYQYTVDASTGLVNEASFKKVK